MSLKAKWNITTRDKKGNSITFLQGEEVKGIDKEEEKRLVRIGAAEELNGSSFNSSKLSKEEELKKSEETK